MFNFIKKLFIKNETQKKETRKNNTSFSLINSEATIWEGNIDNLSFSFINDNDKKERVNGSLTRIYLHELGDFYLTIVADENTMNINEKFIETKLLYKSSRYKFASFCRDVLKQDLTKIFDYAKYIRDEACKLKVVKEITPIKTSFTYLTYPDLKRVRNKTITLIDQYLKNAYGSEMLSGIHPDTKERDYFQKEKIDTMLNSDGYPKYRFDDWLINVMKIQENDS